MGSLFWAVVMVIFILVLSGLYFLQVMTTAIITDRSMDVDTKSRILTHFGSVQHAIVVLFQCVAGGADWNIVFETVEIGGGPFHASVFLFFIFFFVVAVWNIITSLFMERTMKL